MNGKLKIADRIIIFTDGSCTKNPGGNGGWSSLIMTDRDHIITLNGYEPNTTNQRMELTAVISALTYFFSKKRITIYTDSAYVANCFKQKWYKSWLSNGWINSKQEPVANKDLWMRFIKLIEFHDVEIYHVKGHADNPFNNSCDIMAKNIIEFYNKLSKYIDKGDDES